MSATIIAVANQKGGTGKTTTCENLGIGLAREGKHVLLVDTDPQASLTIALGYPRPDDLLVTLTDLMTNVIQERPVKPEEAILSHTEDVDLIPASIMLSGLEVSLVNAMSRETVLKQVLESAKSQYDYILLDCMPSIGMLTINALAAADQVLIPVQANYLSAKGLEQLLQTVSKVKRQINPRLKIEGILLTMVDSRTNCAKEISSLIRETYGGRLKVFSTDIPRSIRAAEISAEGVSIFKHNPGGKVADAYRNLTKEVLKNAEKGENISLTSYDDLFETDESRAESQLERVQNIPVRELIPFKNHPFKVLDDEAMLRTTESIAEYGVLTPLIARPLDHGGYEIISGHRRAHAAELAGLSEVPVLVRDMDDDAATVLMVDSNLQRENILPSERAFAYKMKLEAMKHQGSRSDLTLGQVVPKFKRSTEAIAEGTGESYKQVQRYIRLTNLVPDLLDLVDCKQISFNPAVELSYLSPEEQETFLQAMDEVQAAPSLSQAQRLKKLAQEGNFTMDAAREIMNEVKKGDLERVTFRNEQLRRYFPRSYTAQQMQDTIIKLLDQWQKKKSREHER